MTLQVDERGEVLARLTDYVQIEFLGGPDGDQELKPDVPLLEWGVFTSINIVRLLSFVREEFEIDVPATEITAKNFRNLDSVVDLILSMPRAGQR